MLKVQLRDETLRDRIEHRIVEVGKTPLGVLDRVFDHVLRLKLSLLQNIENVFGAAEPERHARATDGSHGCLGFCYNIIISVP